MTQKQTNKTAQLKKLEATYNVRLEQIRSEYRRLLEEVRGLKTHDNEIKQSVKFVSAFAQKVINPLKELEADAVKLSKETQKLPSFIKSRHLKEFLQYESVLLHSFIKSHAWLRRLLKAYAIETLKEMITSNSANKGLLDYLNRYENKTFVEFSNYHTKKRKVECLIRSIATYAQVEDEGQFRTIPFQQLDNSLRMQQAKILERIRRELISIETRLLAQESKIFKSSSIYLETSPNRQESLVKNHLQDYKESLLSYEEALIFLKNVLESQQSITQWYRRRLIEDAAVKFKKDNKDYLAANENPIKQQKLLTNYLAAFTASIPNADFLDKIITKEERDLYLQQKKEYAPLFKKNVNPLCLSKIEQADTYALRQLKELYYAMVAAEAARVILIKADETVDKKNSYKRHSFFRSSSVTTITANEFQLSSEVQIDQKDFSREMNASLF
ncbi:hypothetical protein [Legionella clemsonensis]|uniref:Uncharacterized protein n=1 Tax=Legionella clemsonensis TaxID=1867846 RepID=A0A222P4K9_9GAMM|nr:hypothetical protein [Legionella clemsonensis]ASQ46753.1 hypothetical protein clem_11035 [Legionella clemsonensis]